MKTLKHSYLVLVLSVFLMASACSVVPEVREVSGCFYVSDDRRWVGDTVTISVEQVLLLDHVVYYPKRQHVRFDSSLCFGIDLIGRDTYLLFAGKKVRIDRSLHTVAVTINDKTFTFRENLLDAPYVLVSSYELDSIPGEQPDSVVLIRDVVPFVFQ